MNEDTTEISTWPVSWNELFEVLRGQGEPEVRSDLYALAATMHHLLSGRPPVPFKFPPVRMLRPDVSPAMEAVLERALKLHADERCGTAREMREAMEGCDAAPAMSAGGGAGISPTSAQTHVGSSPPPVKVAPAPVNPEPAKAARSGVTSAPVPAPSLPLTMTNTRDGADMILIPAGEFLMGSPLGKGSDDEHPQHRVSLDAFYIYKYEVANRQFARFVKETGYKAEGDWNDYAKSGRETHPVVDVSWNDASAYCKWAGGWLPTEAQWEKADRGTDGREYPWGSTWDGNCCNWNKGPKVSGMASIAGGRGSAPVGSFSSGVSPYGVHDMAGNVWEWCSNWYDRNYYRSSPSKNPVGPGSGSSKILRGGSWLNVNADNIRCTYRGRCAPDCWSNSRGFRVCRPSTTH